jgi:trk system potassium uptake protein TrkA
VARIHNRCYIADETLSYKSAFDIGYLICPEQLTSLAITGALDDPGAMAIERFAQNKIEIHRYTIKKRSEAIGVKLRQLELPPGLRLALVERGNEPFAPFGDTQLQADDIVTLIGQVENFKGVRHMFHDHKRRNYDVAVMGGTSMTDWLAEDLLRRNFSIRIFESERVKAIELSERYPELTVLHADPTDPNEFKEEHLEECAAFIAATDDDEHNILGALQAKQLGANRTAAVIQLPTYLPLLEHLGIDLPFSPRIVAAKELTKLIDDCPIKKMTSLARGVAEVYEIGPTSGGIGLDRPLKEITLPKGAFIAAIQREDKLKVPGANDKVQKGDILVFIGPANAEKQLSKLFIG